MTITLAEIMKTGMNNPECAFYVGSFLTQYTYTKLILAASCIYIIVKALDKLALEPIIDKIRTYYKNKRS